MARLLLNKNLLKRFITALPLGVLVIYILLESLILSQIVLCLAFSGCLAEWVWIVMRSQKRISERLAWLIGGIAYIASGSYILLKIAASQPALLLPLLLVIWMADIGAYFTGKILGGPRLAPMISPGKTWSGAIGGFVIAFITGLIVGHFMPGMNKLVRPFTSPMANSCYLALVIIVSQGGDLLESYAKRCFNIKDSSQILPGHGGFLDRLDSILGVGFVLSLLALSASFFDFLE